jgi:hypothetical protein
LFRGLLVGPEELGRLQPTLGRHSLPDSGGSKRAQIHVAILAEPPLTFSGSQPSNPA